MRTPAPKGGWENEPGTALRTAPGTKQTLTFYHLNYYYPLSFL